MLPASRRLRTADDFRLATRRGRRAGSSRLVVHVLERGGEGRVGFVVSRAVGGSVVRNRVRRRLRHLLAERLSVVPVSGSVVVRALPDAAAASTADLAADLERCLRRAGGSEGSA